MIHGSLLLRIQQFISVLVPKRRFKTSLKDIILKRIIRSSPAEVFLYKDVLKSAAELQENTHDETLCNFIEITLCHGCSPINLLHIFRKPFPKNTSEGLLLSNIK